MMRLTRFTVSLLALLALVAIVVGIPVGLVILVGRPIPDPIPGWDELGDMFAGRMPVPADLIISVLATVMWLLWIQVAWATMIEILAAFRGRLARRAAILPGVQLTIGKLVTATTLLTTTFSARPVAAGPLPPVAAVAHVDEAAEAGAPVDATGRAAEEAVAGPELRPYITESGDTWWGIAESTYGSGTRWKEIRNLNLGRTMDDGSVITVGTDLLRPDWRLLLPAGTGALVPAPTPMATTAEEAKDAVSPVGVTASDERTERQVVVERGDTIWGLAEDDLEESGPDPTEVAIASLVNEIAEINRQELDGDPDMIFPGQRLDLPSRPPLAERATGASVEVDLVDGADRATDSGRDASAGASVEVEGDSSTGAGAGASVAADGDGDASVDAGASVEVEGDSSTGAGAGASVAADGDGDASVDAGASVEVDRDVSAVDTSADAPDETATPALPPAGRTAGEPAPPVEPSPLSPQPDDTLVSPLAGASGTAPETVSPAKPLEEEAVAPSPLEEEVAAPTPRPASTARLLPDPSPITARAPSAIGSGVDLPAAANMPALDVTANESPGVDGQLDTAAGRAPIFAGLAALTLVGGYLHRARGRRRKAVLQSRHPGRMPKQPKRRTRSLARRLAAAAEPEHPELLNLGLRALGRLLQDLPADELPKISGVWLSQDRLVLALAEDSVGRPPPAPFTPFADGSGWSLRRCHLDEIQAIARGANGPLPLLTTVGTTTALDLALTTNSRAPADAYGLTSSLLFAVDLEAGRVISVQGPRRTDIIETLSLMALELATSETADQAEIVCVGFGQRLSSFDRVMVVDDLSEIMDDLEAITSRAVYASGDASPFATRVGNGAADTWNPVIVFHADADDPEARSLTELAERTDGGVTAVCGYPTDTGWTFIVDGDVIQCTDLPGSLGSHQFNRARLGDIDLVSELFDGGMDEVDLDDDFWFGPDVADDEVDQLVDGGIGGRTDVPIEDWADRDLDPVDRLGGTEPELPRLTTLRHSVEHRTDTTQPPAPAEPSVGQRASGPGADGGQDPSPAFTVTGSSVGAGAGTEADDEGVAAAGRHLYVVESPSSPSVSDSPVTEAEVNTLTSAPAPTPSTIPASAPDDPIRSSVGASAGHGPDPIRDELGEGARSGDATSAAGPELRVNVLGNFTIGGFHVGDRAKPWKYTKTAELILYLLLHPSGASQDLLMEQLFPEQPPNRPRLNQLVSDARTKALGFANGGAYHLPHASPTEPFYRLASTIEFDLRDFAGHCAKARRADSLEIQAAEWTSALELVQGRPFTLPHDGYGWALPEIEATIVKVEEAAVALADVATELGDHRLAVWATKKGLLTGTGYYELLVKRGRAALLAEDPEEIVRAFADLQMSLEYSGAPEEGMPDLSHHPELAEVYNELSGGGRGRDRTP